MAVIVHLPGRLKCLTSGHTICCGKVDGYGFPDEIPEEISIGDGRYSPPEMLAHIQQRDEVGMMIMGKRDYVAVILDAVPDDDSRLDRVCQRCVCGDPMYTYHPVFISLLACQDMFHPADIF
ncbi:MAG: hypothetical protein HY518_04285 [Candidatus Aenigmarchaeota archaeon]|nr:hypothetical protein [Candidatus Aenigmarchaeota archaeon]